MQQPTNTENQRKTYGFKRKEGDSNPRFPLGEYTLSRRASSATRAPFLVWLNTTFSSLIALRDILVMRFGLQNYRFSSKLP